jgi:hypothetical protein
MNYGYYNSYNQQQVAPQQPVYTPLTFVNGIDEVSKYIVNANTTIYLRDNKSNKLYIKSCDSTGQYSLKTYELVEVGQNTANLSENNEDGIFATKEDLEALEQRIRVALSKIKEGEVANEQ